MKINDSRTLQIIGAAALILATAFVFYQKWRLVTDDSEVAFPSDRNDRVRLNLKKGDCSPNTTRHVRENLLSNQKPITLPLSRNPNPTTEQCLEALASSSLEADRVRAAMLLGHRAKEEGLSAKSIPALITALNNDEAPQIWLVCARALGQYGAEAAEAVPVLMKWFDHPTMRDVAIDALADIGPSAEQAIASMSPIAGDSQERFISRHKAIKAMVRIGGSGHPAVVQVLASAAADVDPRIRLVAQQPLKIFLSEKPVAGITPQPGLSTEH